MRVLRRNDSQYSHCSRWQKKIHLIYDARKRGGIMKARQCIVIVSWGVLALLSSFLKFNFPLGEKSAHLACSAAALPAIAYFVRSKYAVALAGIIWLLLHFWHPIPLTAGIPTLLATLSWRASSEKGLANFGMHIALPLFAMLFFALSPVGAEAWPYSLYWLIPVALSFVPATRWTRALQSTFVAHAVGSVMWVYFVPLAPVQWLALIPVVFVERLLATGVSVTMVAILSQIYQVQSNRIRVLKNP